ncbi:2-isopropylmalate synthase [Polychytrium aggregatum]|uniref:2-isopropylmalate synthase n=1 Tax=Polychytrium aggregatum TaxID=110093 RepID=UPI0022FF35F5|nr:2-isopropylmalate synthase [Polychytrium aggregatum]KAI9206574.1 2-isopropylmalate synthase [Polychytrium aggregatum]
MTHEKDSLIVFDTTLRDGEQSPGVTLNENEKVEIALQLSRLGVDICEAGFPIASPGDFAAVKRIAQEVGPLIEGRKTGKPMRICALARAVPADIERAYEAIKYAPSNRIHTFLATSDIHLQYKLKITREECIARATAAVKYAKSLGCEDVEFSPEDAGRSDRDFLCTILGAVIEAGATTLNIPDTVGYNTPEEFGSLMRHLIANTPGSDKAIWSTHCHNDLGLATANTLSGVLNGARQVEVAVNGIGERAGNTSLEEVVMAIHTHPDYFPVRHNVDTYQIYPTSQLVTKRTGMVIQPNKAIVGSNAFAHESGIHQDGVLKNKLTYEIIQPEVIGLPPPALFLGKHSGRNAFKTRIEELLGSVVYAHHFHEKPALLNSLFGKFKSLADTKKNGVSDDDILALLDDELHIRASGEQVYQLKSLHVMSGSGVSATATVTIIDTTREPAVTSPIIGSPRSEQAGQENQVAGLELSDAAVGHGPVHAVFSAINRVIGCHNVLAAYEVKAVTEGSDSLGKVVVRIHEGPDSSQGQIPKLIPRFEEIDSATYQGQGIDEDILVASAKAYINAINRMKSAKERQSKLEPVQRGEIEVIGGVVPSVPESRNVDV